MEQSIIIIGGGIAGLVAARALADKYNVTILETNERLGGRIYDHTGTGFTMPIPGGAEFMHGNTKRTMALLKEANITYTKLDGAMYRKENGQWQEQDNMIEHWNGLMRQMKQMKIDMTMYDFLQQHYAGDEYAKFRKHVTAYAEGFDLADIEKVSVQSLYEEWAHEDDQYRVDGGYMLLIDYLTSECEKKGCQIITNCTVKQIDWEESDVTIYTSDEQKYYAEKCIITIPIGILQQDMGPATINITPPLHEYISATRKIGFGNVIKAVLQFHKPFWKSDIGFVLSNEVFPTWWTKHPDTTHVLTGWLGGSNASKLSSETDDILLEKALLSVSSIFDIPITQLKENLQAGKIFNWQKYPGVGGGYCYATPETREARKLLNTPLLDTLYFAGEGLCDSFPGTVEAAIISAEKAAHTLLK